MSFCSSHLCTTCRKGDSLLHLSRGHIQVSRCSGQMPWGRSGLSLSLTLCSNEFRCLGRPKSSPLFPLWSQPSWSLAWSIAIGPQPVILRHPFQPVLKPCGQPGSPSKMISRSRHSSAQKPPMASCLIQCEHCLPAALPNPILAGGAASPGWPCSSHTGLLAAPPALNSSSPPALNMLWWL